MTAFLPLEIGGSQPLSISAVPGSPAELPGSAVLAIGDPGRDDVQPGISFLVGDPKCLQAGAGAR